MFRRAIATSPSAPRDADTTPAFRDDVRLDPVRWRRPGRSALLRWTAVTLLLVTAAGAAWTRDSPTCTAAAPAVGSPAPTTPSDGERPALAVPQGSVGVPVRLAEPAALSILRAGDRVDLMAAGTGEPRRVAANALVIGAGTADEASAVLFLAVTPEEAKRTVESPADLRLSVLVRPPT